MALIYLGKNKKLYPHFDGFKGKIKKYPDRDKGWILEGEFDFDDKNGDEDR